MPASVIRGKFDEIVDFAELGRFIDTPVRNYSSGMYMRLGFSVAAHLDPEIVLVDEALAVGDEAFQRKCLRKIQQFQAQGVTALVECSTGGVGLRVDLDLAVSQATGLPIVVPTGNYREPWIPDWVRDASEDELEQWMLGHLTQGVGDTGVIAAWIKKRTGR